MSAGSTSRESRDRIAGALARAGAGLGVAAGAIDVAVGSSIRPWVGNKLDPTRLGLGTIALSAIALTAAIVWQRHGAREGERRLATVLALGVPAAVCFTTIGRLWYLPGLLLLAAVAVILTASTRVELRGAITTRRWLQGLTIVLGGFYVFLGADALGLAGALGLLGGVSIWVSVAVAHSGQRQALVLLWLGALPFALATWWSAVTPLIAVLIITIGAGAAKAAVAALPIPRD